MTNTPAQQSQQARQRNAPARAELDPTHRVNWKIADVKVATRKRNRARLAEPGTVFTSDPQAAAPTYVPQPY